MYFDVCSTMTFIQLDEQMDLKGSEDIKKPKQCSGYYALDKIQYSCNCIDHLLLHSDLLCSYTHD